LKGWVRPVIFAKDFLNKKQTAKAA